jgi:hypothetical protein
VFGRLVTGDAAMNVDRLVLATAGSLIVVSVLLGNLVHPYWYALAAFLGADLAQASVTGYCPLAAMLRRVGVRFGAAFHG